MFKWGEIEGGGTSEVESYGTKVKVIMFRRKQLKCYFTFFVKGN